MPALQHVYVTAHGEFTAASFLGETAQIGIRMALVPDDAIPVYGSTFDIPLNGDVAADYGSDTSTHGTLNKTWTARIGGIGSEENFDAGMQMDVAEDFWTFLNTLKTYQQNNYRWTHIKIAPILADGSYGAGAATYTFSSPLTGAYSTGGCLPPEVALAVSTRAPVIGRRGRGRVYLPAFNVAALVSDGTVNTTTNDAVRAAFVTLIGDMENLPGASAYEGLVMTTSAGKADAIRPLEVRIGSHWDAQRRRQDQAEEIYRVTTLS